MKKILSIFLAILIMVTAFSAVGCNNQKKRDYTKTQLDISYFAGGFGESWIYTAKNEFEEAFKDAHFEEGKTGVEIWIDSNKTMVTDIYANLVANANTKTMYFTSSGNIQTLIGKNLIEDISDVYKAKPDGENGKTIAEMTQDVDNVLDAYGNGTDKFYALPYTQAVIGFVFDYDLFVAKEWLAFADETDIEDLEQQGFTVEAGENQYGTDVLKFVSYAGAEEFVNYKEGEIICKAGKDGKFGTYDDGQPQNVEEWEAMISYICASEGTKPFIFAYSQPDYMDQIAEAAFAQYEGLDNFEITYDYNGTYIRPSDGEEIDITLENGYETFKFEGRKVALEFMEQNLDNESYVHPSSPKLSRSAIDIQKEFIIGYKGTSTNPLSGMIIEGIWWENEARGLFNNLASAGETGRGFGKRDYRYMCLPAFENQKGIDGNGNGSVFSSHEDGAIFINKRAKQGEKDAAKEFIKFVMTTDWLQRFTTMTGGMRPFDYSLTADQYAGLTDFQRHVWNIYHDAENYKVISPNLMMYSEPLNYKSILTVNRWSAKVNNFDYIRPIVGLRAKNITAQKYFDGQSAYFTTGTWDAMLKAIK